MNDEATHQQDTTAATESDTGTATPPRGLSIALLAEKLDEHAQPCKLGGGAAVMMRAVTASHRDVMSDQIPDFVVPETWKNASGEVSAGNRKAAEIKKAQASARQLALRILCSGRGRDGITTTAGEQWNAQRDTAWCEAAADEILASLPDEMFFDLLAFTRRINPFGGGDAAFNGTGADAGN